MGRYLYILILIVGSLGFLEGCGGGVNQHNLQGGSEAGNPPDSYRRVIGQLPSAAEAKRLGLEPESEDCAAYKVHATDESGRYTFSVVDEDCTFNLLLSLDSPNSLSLAVNPHERVPVMFFEENSSSLSGFVTLQSSVRIVDLGLLIIMETESGFVAVPENEPKAEDDQDGDGIPDFADEDYDLDEDNYEDAPEEYSDESEAPEPGPTITPFNLERVPMDGPIDTNPGSRFFGDDEDEDESSGKLPKAEKKLNPVLTRVHSY